MPTDPRPDRKPDIGALGVLGAEGSWQDLPDWARFLVDTGLAAGRTPVDGRRCTIAIVLPTRSYAAALCAAGAAIASHEIEAAISAADHFRELGSLDIGAPVQLQIKRNGKWRAAPGTFLGATDDGISIEYDDSAVATKLKVPPALSWQVTVAADSSKRSKARILAVNPFTEAILSRAGARQFAAGGAVASLIVGFRKHVEEEMQHRVFAARGETGNKAVAGALDDLARLQNQSGAGTAYRTAVHPPHGSVPRVPSGDPPVVIFDGANGYLNFRDRFRASHAVVLIDRTEPQIENVIYQIQSDYDQKRLHDGAPLPLPAAPPCIETHSFWLAAP